jgi:hypothetical protein
MNRVLRHWITCDHTAWLAPDQLAEPVVVLEVTGLNRGRGQGITEAELVQDGYGVWQEIDAHTEGLDGADALEHLRSDAMRVQAQGSRKAADATADEYPAKIRT